MFVRAVCAMTATETNLRNWARDSDFYFVYFSVLFFCYLFLCFLCFRFRFRFVFDVQYTCLVFVCLSLIFCVFFNSSLKSLLPCNHIH